MSSIPKSCLKTNTMNVSDQVLEDEHEDLQEYLFPMDSLRELFDINTCVQIRHQQIKHQVAIQESEAPLDTWLQYIAWARKRFPVNDETQFPFAYQVINHCGVSLLEPEYACYHDDARYVDIWIECITYAEEQEAQDTLQEQLSDGIGKTIATFYYAYATILEEVGELEKAESVYQKGFENQAQPLTRLTSEFLDFKKRSTGKKSKATKPVVVSEPVKQVSSNIPFEYVSLKKRNMAQEVSQSTSSHNSMLCVLKQDNINIGYDPSLLTQEGKEVCFIDVYIREWQQLGYLQASQQPDLAVMADIVIPSDIVLDKPIEKKLKTVTATPLKSRPVSTISEPSTIVSNNTDHTNNTINNKTINTSKRMLEEEPSKDNQDSGKTSKFAFEMISDIFAATPEKPKPAKREFGRALQENTHIPKKQEEAASGMLFLSGDSETTVCLGKAFQEPKPAYNPMYDETGDVTRMCMAEAKMMANQKMADAKDVVFFVDDDEDDDDMKHQAELVRLNTMNNNTKKRKAEEAPIVVVDNSQNIITDENNKRGTIRSRFGATKGKSLALGGRKSIVGSKSQVLGSVEDIDALQSKEEAEFQKDMTFVPFDMEEDIQQPPPVQVKKKGLSVKKDDVVVTTNTEQMSTPVMPTSTKKLGLGERKEDPVLRSNDNAIIEPPKKGLQASTKDVSRSTTPSIMTSMTKEIPVMQYDAPINLDSRATKNLLLSFAVHNLCSSTSDKSGNSCALRRLYGNESVRNNFAIPGLPEKMTISESISQSSQMTISSGLQTLPEVTDADVELEFAEYTLFVTKVETRANLHDTKVSDKVILCLGTTPSSTAAYTSVLVGGVYMYLHAYILTVLKQRLGTYSATTIMPQMHPQESIITYTTTPLASEDPKEALLTSLLGDIDTADDDVYSDPTFQPIVQTDTPICVYLACNTVDPMFTFADASKYLTETATEPLILYTIACLLRCVTRTHAAGVVHNNQTAESFIVRIPDEMHQGNTAYDTTGKQGFWGHVGYCLDGFEQAIDLASFAQFPGISTMTMPTYQKATKRTSCVFDNDIYSTLSIIYKALMHQPMEVTYSNGQCTIEHINFPKISSATKATLTKLFTALLNLPVYNPNNATLDSYMKEYQQYMQTSTAILESEFLSNTRLTSILKADICKQNTQLQM